MNDSPSGRMGMRAAACLGQTAEHAAAGYCDVLRAWGEVLIAFAAVSVSHTGTGRHKSTRK